MDLPAIQASSPLQEFVDLPEISSKTQSLLTTLCASSNSLSCASSRTRGKKVQFSDSKQYSDAPTTHINDDEITHQPKISVTIPRERPPLKGILKSSIVYKQPLALSKVKSFANILNSHLNALATKDLDLRKEAYTNFTNTVKSCINTMDFRSLKSILNKIYHYIERDLKLVDDDGRPNSSLIVHALNLLRALQTKSNFVGSFPQDFQVFLVDFCIENFSKPLMSKDVKKNLIFVLANQGFTQKVINSDRTGKLILALHSIEKYSKGKSILTGRTEIYRGLLQTSRLHMAMQTQWIKDLLHCMNNSYEPIQNSAIIFGFEAAVELGDYRTVSNATTTLLNSDAVVEGEKISYWAIYFQNLMEKMNSEHVAFVPKVWSVIILLQRHKTQMLIKAPFFKPLLEVLTSCFNSKDIETQKEARYAWNRFIFFMQLSEETPEFIRNMLIRPYIQSFPRQKSNICLKHVYSLLYYAFRPGCQWTQLNLFWDEYVSVLVSETFLVSQGCDKGKVRKFADITTTILIHLFDTRPSKVWTHKRVVQSLGSNDIPADEIPALDSKWVRKNYGRVLPVFFSILRRLFWDLGDSSSLVAQAWKYYITSIASPAKKEIQISIETIDCISKILELLSQIWNTGVTGLNALNPSNTVQGPHEYLSSVGMMISVMVSDLGIHTFTKGNLSINVTLNTLTPTPIPSQQSLETKTNSRSLLHYLVHLFLKPCPGMIYDSNFQQIFAHILTPFFDNRASQASKLATAADLVSLLPTEGEEVLPVKMAWQALANFAVEAIKIDDIIGYTNGNLSPIEGYSSIIMILESGIKISPDMILEGWQELLESYFNLVAQLPGDSGKVFSVIESLSVILCRKSCGPSYLPTLIRRIEYPEGQPATDPAQRSLSPVDLKELKHEYSDPYSHFYEYLRASLESSTWENHKNGDIIDLVNSLFKRSPIQLIPGIFVKIQNALSPWINQYDSNLHPPKNSIAALWSTFNSALVWIMENGDLEQILNDFVTLICSGLESRDSGIKNTTLKMCDLISIASSDIEYPERMKDALSRLQMKTCDIKLSIIQGDSYSEQEFDKIGPLDCLHIHSKSREYPKGALKSPTIAQTQPSSITMSPKLIPQVIIEMDSSKISFDKGTSTKKGTATKDLAEQLSCRDKPETQPESHKSPPAARSVIGTWNLRSNQKKAEKIERRKSLVTPTNNSDRELKRRSAHSKSPLDRSPLKSYDRPSRRSTRLSNTIKPVILLSSSTPPVNKNNLASHVVSRKRKRRSSVVTSPILETTTKPSTKNTSVLKRDRCTISTRNMTHNVNVNNTNKLRDDSNRYHTSSVCLSNAKLLESPLSCRPPTKKRKSAVDTEVLNNQESSLNQLPDNRGELKRSPILEGSPLEINSNFQNDGNGFLDLDTFIELKNNNFTDFSRIKDMTNEDSSQRQQIKQKYLNEAQVAVKYNIKHIASDSEMGYYSDSAIVSTVIQTAKKYGDGLRSILITKFDKMKKNIENTDNELVDRDKSSNQSLTENPKKILCRDNGPVADGLLPDGELNKSELSFLKESNLTSIPFRSSASGSADRISQASENPKISVTKNTQCILNTIDCLILTLQNANLGIKDIRRIEDKLIGLKRALDDAESRCQ